MAITQLNGTNVATYQGLSRTTYPQLNAQIVDASSATLNFGQVLSEEIVDYADELCFERGQMGKPNVLVASRSGARSYWKSLKADRVINDPAGQFQGGKGDLFVRLGARVIKVRVARKIPLSRAFLIDTKPFKRLKIGSGKWDDVTGSIWNRVTNSTGRKDAAYAVYIEEEELACGAPARSAKITNLAAA